MKTLLLIPLSVVSLVAGSFFGYSTKALDTKPRLGSSVPSDTNGDTFKKGDTDFPIPLGILEWANRLKAAEKIEFVGLWADACNDLNLGFVKRYMLIARWADLDPDNALEFLIDENALCEVEWLMWIWLRQDQAKALDAIANTRVGMFFDLDSPLTDIAITSPIRLIEEFDSSKKEFRITGSTPYEIAFQQLAKENRVIAIALAESKEGQYRKAAFGAIAAEWAKLDRVKALAWADSLDEKDRNVAFEGIVRASAETDPDWAGEQLSAIRGNHFTASENSDGVGLTIARSLLNKSPLSFLEWVEKYSSGGDQMIMALNLAPELATRYPEQLVDVLSGIQDANLQETMLESLEYRAGSHETVLKNVQEITDNSLKQRFLAAYVKRWSAVDPYSAISFVESLPEAERDPSLVKSIVHNLNAYHPGSQAALAFIQGQPEDQVESLTAEWLSATVKENPYIALQNLEALNLSAEVYEETIQGIGTSWASSDPEASLAWATNLESGPTQQKIVSDVFTRLTDRDPMEASRKLATMESGIVRDTAVRAFVRSASDYAPDETLQWALTIDSPAVRDELVRATLSAVSPSQAMKVLENSGIESEALNQYRVEVEARLNNIQDKLGVK